MALKDFNCTVNAHVETDGHIRHTYDLYICTGGKHVEEADAQDLTLEDLKLLRAEIEHSINFEKALRNGDI